MLKRVMTALLSAIMMLSSIGVTFAQEDVNHPLVEDAVYYLGEVGENTLIPKEALQSTSGYIITSVKVNNPGSDGATEATLVVTLSDRVTGKILETVEDTQSVTSTTQEITLSKGINYNCSAQKLDYYVVDQNGASLRNAPPMPVEEIRYSAKIRYVKLDWDTPKDDFSSVKEYIIKRDGAEIARTDKNTYVDPADGERDGVTLTYSVTAVDHGGLLSEEKTVTLTTPSYATAHLMPTEEETREKSSGLTFVYVDNKTTDVYGQDISTLGGKHTDVNGKELPYRNTVHWLNGSSDRTTYMLFSVDSQIIEDTDNEVTVEVTYLDKGTHNLKFQYYRTENLGQYGFDTPLTNTGEWKTVKIERTNFSRPLGESGYNNSNCSFRIVSGDTKEILYISKVRIIPTEDIGNDIKELLYPSDPSLGAFVTYGANDDEDRENCMKFYYSDWNELAPTEQQSQRVFYNGEWCRRTFEYLDKGVQRISYLNYKIDPTILPERDNHVKISIRHYNDGTPIRLKYFKPDGSKGSKSVNVIPDPSTVGTWTTTVVDIPNFSISDQDVSDGWKSIGQFNLSSNATWGEGKVIYVSSVKVEKVTEGTDPDEPDAPQQPQEPAGDPTQGAWIIFGETQSSDTSNCMNFYYSEWNEESPTEQQSSSVVYEGVGSRRTHSLTASDSSTRNTQLFFTIGSSVLGDNDNDVKMTIKYYNDGVTPLRIKYFTPEGQKNFKIDPDAENIGWRTVTKELTDFSIKDEHISDGWKPLGQFNIYSDVPNSPIYVSSVKVEKVVPVEYDVTVFMAGDSIAQHQSESALPKSGWFQHLEKFFDSSVGFDNRALGGMSARSFRERKVNSSGVEDANGTAPWTSLLEDAKAGDYVLISFAHNDSVTSKTADYTDPSLSMDAEFGANGKASYKYYLKKYVEEARAKGVNPIFVTAVESHNTLGDYNPPQFKSYADAMVEAGAALDVPVLNINEATAQLYTSYGAVNDKVFFRLISATDLGSKPMSDGVHLRDYGALHVANLFRTLLKNTSCHLNNKLLNAYTQPASIFVDDRFRTDITLVERDGKYLVPAVKVLEGLDATEIVSNETTFSAKVRIPNNNPAEEAVYDEKVITATVGSMNYTVGGATATMDYAPELIDGSIYIDSAFFEDICGGNVYYDEFMKMTTILTGINESAMPFTETFDGFVGSKTSNVYPDGWESGYFVANQSYMIGEITEGSNNEAIKLVRENADTALPYYLIHDFEYTSSQTFTMRVKASNVTSRKDIRLWVNDSSKGGSAFVIAAKLADGKISGPNSVTVNPYILNADEWVTLKFIVVIVDDENHITTNMFTYVVDDNGDETFIGNYEVPYSTGMVEGIRFEMHNGANDALYIDDFEVKAYTGGFPSIPQPDDPDEPDEPDTPAGDPAQGGWVKFGATVAADETNCITYTADTDCVNTTYEGKASIRMPHKNSGGSRNYIYFTLNDEVLGNSAKANVTITYYDAGVSPRIEYYNSNNSSKNPVIDPSPNNSGWKTVTLPLEDLPMTDNGGRWSYNFRIRSNSGDNPTLDSIYIAQIVVERISTEDPTQGGWVKFGATAAADETNCMEISYNADVEAPPVNAIYNGKNSLKVPHYAATGTRNYIYFTVDDEVLNGSSKADVKITYYDEGITPRLEYYNASNEFKGLVIDTNVSSSGWKTVTLELADLPVTKPAGWPGQFRLRSDSGNPPATEAIYIAEIKVEKHQETTPDEPDDPDVSTDDPTQGGWVKFGATAAADETNCMEISYNADVEAPPVNATYNGKNSLKVPHYAATGTRNYIYFTVDDEVLNGSSKADVKITYYDEGITPRLEYYNASNEFKGLVIDTDVSSSGWKTVTLELTDLPVTQKYGWSGQLRLRSDSGNPPATEAIYIAEIRVEKHQETTPDEPDEPDVSTDDPTQGGWVKFGATAAADDTNCMQYTYDTTDANACTSTTYSDKACLRMPHLTSGGSRTYVYFTLDEDVLESSRGAKLTVTYYDAGVSPRIEYYNSNNESKNPVIDSSPDNSGWKTVTLELTDLPVTQKYGWSGQFRFRSNSGSNPTLDSIYIADVKIETLDVDDPTQGGWVKFGATAAADDTNCIEYTYDITDSNCCTTTTYNEKTCVKMPHLTSSGSRNYIYFTFDEDVLREDSKANITISYYDEGVSPRLEYYNASNEFKNPVFDASPSNTGWKTVTLTVEDLPFTQRSGWPGLFRIRSNSNSGETTEAIYISNIWVETFALPQIWMAGDSLSAIYRDDQRPQTGWMEVFASEYASEHTVQNRAIGGESSKSFYDRGYLENILSSAKRGDYLFIQFSHNDTHEGTENEYRHTDPGDWSDDTKTTWVPSTYEEYMEKYVTEAMEAGMRPVILTSVAWARYVDGEFEGRTYRNLERYAEGAKYVAEKYGIPLVEVFEPTCTYHEETTSEEDHKAYYMYVELCSVENADECANKERHSDWDHTWCANFSTAKADNVHVNHKGAAWVADIVAEGIFDLNLPICEYLRNN